MSHKLVCDRCSVVHDGKTLNWSVWQRKAMGGDSFTLDFCDRCTRVLKIVYKRPVPDGHPFDADPLMVKK